MAAGCSSDDDGDVVEIPGTVPNVLNYEIRQDTGVSMTLSQNPSATVTATSLTGTFDRITEAFTLNVQPAAMLVATDFLTQLDIDLGGTDFSNYSLHVTSEVAWVGDGNPTSGEFDIFDDAVRKITVRVIPDANSTGMPGVQITYYPDGAGSPGTSDSVELTWAEFDAVFDEPAAQEYARIAAFADSLLRFVYEQGNLVILALEFIGENDVILETSGTFVESCDTLPAPASDPIVPNLGSSVVNWTDVDNDQGISSGDTVFVDFFDCWDDDPADTIDTLFNGGIQFLNYIEVQSGGVITRVGFESVGGTGGIDFTGLRITETDTQPNVVIIEPDTITLSGGFSMVFTAP